MEAYLVAEEVLERAIRIERGERLDGAVLARLIKQLTELEVEEGGPYATVRGGDVDIGLNLVIARFLNALGVHLPKLDAYINAAIKVHAHSRVFDDERLAELKAWRAPLQTRQHESLSVEEERIMALIRATAEERFSTLPMSMQRNALNVIERTIKGNSDMQMSLMPLYMRQALGSRGFRYDDDYIALLGLTNTLFWSAFIVYDDFWDEDEAADRNLLPIANLFARHYTDVFTHLFPDDSSFRVFFHREMDKLDAANAWEISACRARVEDSVFYIPQKLPVYGDFSIKFHPAAGHMFGPIALVLDCGYDLSSPDIAHTIDYFRHYLIAMQMNDDMHDWKEDLTRGHISTAVAVLLEGWQEQYPMRDRIDLVTDMAALEQLFWFGSLKPLCDAVLEHAAFSRRALMNVTYVADSRPLEKYIRRNESVVQEALSAHRTAHDFIRVFS